MGGGIDLSKYRNTKIYLYAGQLTEVSLLNIAGSGNIYSIIANSSALYVRYSVYIDGNIRFNIDSNQSGISAVACKNKALENPSIQAYALLPYYNSSGESPEYLSQKVIARNIQQETNISNGIVLLPETISYKSSFEIRGKVMSTDATSGSNGLITEYTVN